MGDGITKTEFCVLFFVFPLLFSAAFATLQFVLFADYATSALALWQQSGNFHFSHTPVLDSNLRITYTKASEMEIQRTHLCYASTTVWSLALCVLQGAFERGS